MVLWMDVLGATNKKGDNRLWNFALQREIMDCGILPCKGLTKGDNGLGNFVLQREIMDWEILPCKGLTKGDNRLGNFALQRVNKGRLWIGKFCLAKG